MCNHMMKAMEKECLIKNLKQILIINLICKSHLTSLSTTSAPIFSGSQTWVYIRIAREVIKIQIPVPRLQSLWFSKPG